MRLKKLQFLISVLSIMSSAAYSQTQKILPTDSLEIKIKQVENSLSPLVQTKGEALWNLEEQMQKYNIAGLSLAVINNYQVEWAKGYGVTNSKEKTNVTNQTVFQAASMSKFVNAVALMKLKEQENISLDKDINTLLTSWEFPYDKTISEQPVTLRQLLSHTAGLSTHGFSGYKDSKNLPTIIQTLEGRNPANSERVKPIFRPSKKFKYSGGGTTLTQLILSDVTHSSYEQFVEKNLLKPLGMNHSFYSIEIDKYPNQLASGHLGNSKPLRNGYNIYPESAAAGFWTTPTDLAKLITDLQLSLTNQNAKILSNQSGQEMITPGLENQNSALGLFVEIENREKYLQHSGSNEGFRGKFYFEATNGKGVVVMVNGPNTKIIEEIIRSVASVYNWPGFENFEASSEINLADSDLKRYVGTYVSDNRTILVSLKKGALTVEEKRKWSSRLTPLNKSSFVIDIVKPRATLDFIVDEGGVVRKLIVHQGEPLEWTKVE